jgi:hypothetical protein
VRRSMSLVRTAHLRSILVRGAYEETRVILAIGVMGWMEGVAWGIACMIIRCDSSIAFGGKRRWLPAFLRFGSLVW